MVIKEETQTSGDGRGDTHVSTVTAKKALNLD